MPLTFWPLKKDLISDGRNAGPQAFEGLNVPPAALDAARAAGGGSSPLRKVSPLPIAFRKSKYVRRIMAHAEG